MANLKDISQYGQSYPVKMGLVSSFGYFDFIGTAPEAITDHVQRTINLFIEQFKRKDILIKFLTAFIKRVQELEYVFQDLLIMKDIDLATGDRLDLLGELVGEPRNFRIDDIYREAIKLRIFINKSSGEPEVVISAFKAIVNPSEMHIFEAGNANLLINFKSLIAPPSDLVERLNLIAPSGVKIILSWAIDDDPDFAFSGEGGYPPDANTLGFGETGATNVNEGGKFVEIITP